MSETSDLELDFINEQKGEGSLSIYFSDGNIRDYVGYDIHPEDLEAIYFDGIGVPRWESLNAESVEEQTAMYWDAFNKCMADYPLIGRVRDTDERVIYGRNEIAGLEEECGRIVSAGKSERARRAVMKLSIAAGKAVQKGLDLELTPSRHHLMPAS